MAFAAFSRNNALARGIRIWKDGFCFQRLLGREIDAGNNESLGVLFSEELQNLAARVEGTIVTKISEGVSLSGAFELKQVEVELVSS